MRILGYIENAHCNITVMTANNKFILKFESGSYEQTYKIKPNQYIDNLEDIKALVDETFVSTVMQQFNVMHRVGGEALNRLIGTSETEDFEHII